MVDTFAFGPELEHSPTDAPDDGVAEGSDAYAYDTATGHGAQGGDACADGIATPGRGGRKKGCTMREKVLRNIRIGAAGPEPTTLSEKRRRTALKRWEEAREVNATTARCQRANPTLP